MIDWNTMPKGTKVLVKDKCNRNWTKATFVTYWKDFYYVEAMQGRNLQRWEECKPYEEDAE